MMDTMTPIYQRLLQNSGKGQQRGLQERFANMIQSGEPYDQFQTVIDTHTHNAITNHFEALLPKLKEVFETLISEFKLITDGHENDIIDREDLKHRAEALEFVVGAKKQLDGPIAENFARSALASSSDKEVRIKRERSV